MKTLSLLALALVAAPVPQDGTATGRITGRISPAGVSIRIVAKLKGTDASKQENVKGEVTLAKAGEFSIDKLPPGNYDLLFTLQGDDAGKYMATRWSEVEVEAGKTTPGINYRLTPRGADALIDEVLVAFDKGVAEKDAKAVIASLDCRIKDAPGWFREGRLYVVDIPDDKSVDEMLKAFMKKTGVSLAEANAIARAK